MTLTLQRSALAELAPPGTTGEGCLTRIALAPGLSLGTIELRLDAPFVFDSETFPTASLGLVLDGQASSETRFIDRGFEPDDLWIVADNDRRPCRTVIQPGRPVRAVDLVVTPDWFAGQAALDGDDPLLEALYGAMTRPLALRRRTLDARLRQLAWSVLRPPVGGRLLELYYESRALDLLIELAQSLRSPDGASPACPLRARDLERAAAVRAHIDRDPTGVDTLAELAAAFAVSSSKLKRDFRAAFGVAVGGYLVEARLSLARRLLEREGLSVSEVAYRVGYDHPANFATAFRRRFGLPPSASRR